MDSVRAKCLTTHTPCSDSDFDGEALEHIASCDATTIVKGDGHRMDNRLLYDTFIRHHSLAVRYAVPMAVAALMMMAAVLCKVVSGYLATSPVPRSSSEYEPLVKADRITLN